MERLQKVIANAGITSRRKAEQLILEGKVKVNGKVVQELGVQVDYNKDIIMVNNRQIHLEKEKIVLLFHKPKKVITSVKDPQGRKTVMDYIQVSQRIYPVGRLDYETEGLLLLTNDGELANHLMHPSYELDKTYEAIVKGVPNHEELELLRKGVPLEDGITSPAEVHLINSNANKKSKVKITIHEGRNRQVRRMFQYIKKPVYFLKRTRYGFLNLEGINIGEYRVLSKNEVCKLKKMVQLPCE